MRAKLILEFDLELPDDFPNTAQNRIFLFNEIKKELPEEIELKRVSVFTPYSELEIA